MKIILPLLVLTVAGLVSAAVIMLKPEPVRIDPVPVIPLVEVIDATPESTLLTVSSQGTVQPRLQTTLVAEVSGRIIEVSPHFRPGGFFRAGESLLRLDPADHAANLALEEAALAQAEYTLEREQAEAEQAALDWKDLGIGSPTSLALREPQIRQAQAQLTSAQARVAKAKRDLERASATVPFDGRVRETFVDLGGYVSGNPGTILATVYATDAVEIRLPLTPEELNRITLPDPRPGESPGDGPRVTLSSRQGRHLHTWEGKLVRAEAAFDSRSRLTHVVAEVKDPYTRDPGQPTRPPLQPGMFVQASIEGLPLPEAIAIPRHALREGNTVLVADQADTLQRREVTVASADTQTAILEAGLQPGDRVIVSPMDYAIPGTPLNITTLQTND